MSAAILIIHTDASLLASGVAFAIGATIADAVGAELAVCAARFACPPWWTSSLAERHAALEALLHARDLGADVIELRTDDRSLADVFGGSGQHVGISEARRALADYVRRLREAADAFRSVHVVAVPREDNRRADQLARFAAAAPEGERSRRLASMDRVEPRAGWWVRRAVMGLALPRVPMVAAAPTTIEAGR